MSDPGEGGANGNDLLDVEKSAANFGFGDGGHNIGKNLGKGEDGAIDGGFTRREFMSNRGTISKEVIATGADLRFGIGSIRSITMDMEHHVAGHITDGDVGV